MARRFVLNDLFVAEHRRRKRVGERLLQAAVEYARAVGAVRQTLSTALEHAGAFCVYNLPTKG